MRKVSPKPTTVEVLEVKLANVANAVEKLEHIVIELKDNHLHHISLQLNELQHTMNNVSSCKDDIQVLQKQLDTHETQLKVASAVWKSMIVAAIFILPSTLNALIMELKNLLHF